MLKIKNFACEGSVAGQGIIMTDSESPVFTYYVESDKQNVSVAKAEIKVNGWTGDAKNQTGVAYKGKKLQPLTTYTATLTVTDNNGETDCAELTFETGYMGSMSATNAKWITDGSYQFTAKGTSPVPMIFKKSIKLSKAVKSVKVYSTALGIYELFLDGKKVGDEYFAPGFTSYKSFLQYQMHDITAQAASGKELTLTATVAGGWAVGAFVFSRVNRVTAPRQAFKAIVRVVYEDGTVENIVTDENWQVTMDGKLRFAEFYDGEVYDATVDEKVYNWKSATVESVKVKPQLIADYSAPVCEHEVFKPISVNKLASGELIYDFGQNFAGIVRFKVNGKKGQVITIRHAEILKANGELHTAFLRSAKCQIIYTCKDGEQSYAPSMTYMGFRYAGISGIDEKDIIDVEGVALYSDMAEKGHFTCSNDMINRLQQNIVWGGKSNFLDIPTDCPQRDERMGWTGDIAVFASTACFNFDMRRFLDKWLKDVKAEQTRGGGIPNTVPVQGYGFPVTMPKKAIAFWGDACVFVPWAEYMSTGDIEVLRKMYPTMKKYLKACTFWAKLFSFGKKKYIWNDIPAMQFGDWVAPDVPQMGQWQARCTWTGTASIMYSSSLVAKIAALLGEKEDEKFYKELSEKTADAYTTVLMENGKLLKEEFQTGYVLPLQFKMFADEQQKSNAAKNLVAMLEKNDYCIGTGFPGTPYILFALADNGYTDVAFKMLTNTKCPSWLYEVKVGATTIWERWDGLNEDGVCTIGDDGTGGMISYNHYAFGAVGDFLYRRVAGIEAIEGGYKRFTVAPVVGGGLTEAQADVISAYGKISSAWKIAGGKFTLCVEVPVGTTCDIVLPSGKCETVGSGKYEYSEQM